MLRFSIATTRDRRFIIASILSCAKIGRCVLDAYIPVSMRDIKPEIHSILSSHRTLRGDPAFAYIYKRNRKRVGVAIIRYDRANCMEPALYAMAVASGYRGKGYGPMIIEDIERSCLSAGSHNVHSDRAVTMRKSFERRIHDDHHVSSTDRRIINDYREAA